MKTSDLRVKDVTLSGTPTSSPARQGTDQQIANRALRDQIRLAWHALPAAARNGFQSLCRLLPENQGRTRPKITAFFLFSSLNQAATYSGATSPITTAPATPQYPDPLPSTLRLVSLRTSPTVWSLRVKGGTYAGALAVYGAPSVMAATNIYKKGSWRLIGSLPNGIPAGSAGADLTALYLSVYPAPQNGEKVAIKLVGVSASGFRTGEYFLPALTGAIGDEAEGTDGEETNGALHVA